MTEPQNLTIDRDGAKTLRGIKKKYLPMRIQYKKIISMRYVIRTAEKKV